MKYIYTEKDLDLISWERIDKFIDKIYKDVNNYLIENNLQIKYIIPIMRGGGIPAIIFSHLFDVIDMLPIQLKHNSNTKNIDKKIGLEYINNTSIEENECKKLNINYNLVSVYPWENIEEELRELNN